MDERLLRMVEENYRLTINRYNILRDIDRTYVVAIQAVQGDFVLKSIYKPPERIRFILDAESYLRQKGIPIPQVWPTVTNQPFFLWNNHPYFLQQFVKGKRIRLASDKLIKQRGAILGKVHANSLGFHSRFGLRYLSTPTWPEQYDAELRSLEQWSRANCLTKQKKMKALRDASKFFLKIGVQAKDTLLSSPFYAQLKNMPMWKQYLCHGDFHTGNVLWSSNNATFHIIDWEYVRYDFPSVDLARLLSIIMRDDGRWSEGRFETLLNGYLRENPLPHPQLGLLYLDLSFPHNLERFLRRKWYEEMSTEEVEKYIRRETEKTKHLLKLRKFYRF